MNAQPIHTTPALLIRGSEPAPERNPAAVYIAALAPGSRPTMCHALDVIADILTAGVASQIAPGAPRRAVAWPRLRVAHTQAVRAAVADRYAPATANKLLAALRGVLREAWRLQLAPAADIQRATDLKPVRGSGLLRGRSLSQGELGALFEAARRQHHEATQLRDAALLAVLYAGGLRRAEVAALDLADYDTEAGSLVVRGKGQKLRMLYVRNGAQAALTAWCRVRGAAPGPLLLPIDKAGRIALRRLTTQAVFLRLKALAAQARLTKSLSPHDLRRSFISDLLDNGCDLVTVQKLAGHANPTTTGRYDRRDERSQQRAAETLHVPF